jgi:hypothetical protein
VETELASLDLSSAQLFLKEFAAETRRRGDGLFRKGAVSDLALDNPAPSFSCRVLDGNGYEVSLECLPEDEWSGECSCSQASDCPHIVAAVFALLAEHRMARVRSLSTGAMDREPTAAGRTLPARAPSKSLELRLTEATGEELSREAKGFIQRVRRVYEKCRPSRQLTWWDLQELGTSFRAGGYWGAPEIWPSFPETEYEFWLYVANAMQEQGHRFPGFMQPITNLAEIKPRLAAWRRAIEIAAWKDKLSRLQRQEPRTNPLSEAEVDLRIVIDSRGVELQWQPAEEAAFEPIKATRFRQLCNEYEVGRARFKPEAEWLFQCFAQDYDYGAKVHYSFEDDAVEEVLGRVLRARPLESRTVTLDGQPLLRSSETLRWKLEPADSDDGDYRFFLVKEDGTPAPNVRLSLPGHPALYLTSEAVFPGPELIPGVVEPAAENRIPASAIECPEGVAFLQSWGFELPPRIRERVKMIPYEITIDCALRRSYPGSEQEECHIAMVAESADGRRQTWSGYNWLDDTPHRVRTKRNNTSEIRVHDSGRLREAAAVLAPLNPKPSPYGKGLTLRLTRKFPEAFGSWLKTVPPYITVRLQGELASFQSADVAGRVRLAVSEVEIDWFDLQVVLDVADTTLTPEEIRLLLNAKGGFVRLAGRGWHRLQFDLGEQEDEQLARLGLSPRDLSAQPQRLHALQLADPAARKFLPQQQVEQIQRRAGEIKARVAPELPAGIKAELRPYQLEGFHFLAYLAANRFGGILADDMGLGKTLQTLAWLLWLRAPTEPVHGADSKPASTRGPSPALVVCPKSVMDNWHAEAARFAPELRVRVWSASELEGLHHQLETADLHVLNYSQLRTLDETLNPVRWLAVILDEGQYIKNPSSQTAQVARSLKAEHRLILSGTPIENRLLDLWSLMGFAMPGVLGSRAQFAKLYDAKGDPLARRRLAARVRPFLLRRTKSQVAKDLPDRIEEDLFCEMEGEQQMLYRAELKRAQQLLLKIQTQKELAQQQFHFLTSLLRLRQVCCHPRLLKTDSTAASAKTESLLEQLEPLMEEGQKVLVFSQFVQMLDLLRPILEEKQWPVFYLAGHTENRGELVRQFQSTEGPAIFLISLKAGGFGLNLTAASYVVLFDPWWNPAVENQAIDRTHRIGQANKVIAYRLLIKNSIEEKIRALQKQKRALAEDVLGEEKFAQSLTLDDLRFLFAD